MSQPKVLITKRIPELATRLLVKAGFLVKTYDEIGPLSHEELMVAAKNYDAILTMLSDNINEVFIEQNQHLKIIANYAVGFNNININQAKKYNIAVANTPNVLTEATAELTLSLILSLSRRINLASDYIQKGNWKSWEPLGFLGPTLYRKTIGLIGMGRIAKELARLCEQAFSMKVLYFSRSDKNTELDELLSTSDIVSLHCDLNPETMNMFNLSYFKKMKDSALFINTSRGEVHNEKDLIYALKNKLIAGAALDVTNPEPIDLNSALLKMKNVLITPHIGSATYEARNSMAKLAAENIIAVLNKKKAPSLVIT